MRDAIQAWLGPSFCFRERGARTSQLPVSSGGFILSLDFLPIFVPEVKPTVDALPIEMEQKIRSGDREMYGFGPKRSKADPALMPHASVDDAIGAFLAEFAS